MRCRTCDYPLWNIEGTSCPECGSAFARGDYRFRQGAVRFRCPGCRTAFYGTSPSGLPEPSSFACPTCSRALTLESMLLEPAEGVAEEETGPPPNPWLQRKKIGLVRGWFRTVLKVLAAPQELIASVPGNAPLGDALLFAATTSIAGVLVMLALGAVVTPILLAFVSLPKGIWWTVLVQVLIMGSSVLWVLIGTIAAGLCAHAFLALTGSARGGLARSLQAILYATGGANAVNLIPCPCSAVLVPVWGAVATALMLKTVHRTSGLKAGLAAAASFLTSFLVILALSLTPAMLGVSGTAVRFNRTTLTASQVDVEDIVPFLVDPAKRPRTPFDLVANGAVSPELFRELVRPDKPDLVRIGPLDADAMDVATTAELRREADRLAALAPSEPGAFRIERAVFLYPLATDDPDDWLVVIEPRRSRDGSAFGTFHVLRGKGEISFHSSTIEGAVAAENARRANAGRSPMPPLGSVADLESSVAPAPPPVTP